MASPCGHTYPSTDCLDCEVPLTDAATFGAAADLLKMAESAWSVSPAERSIYTSSELAAYYLSLVRQHLDRLQLRVAPDIRP